MKTTLTKILSLALIVSLFCLDGCFLFPNDHKETLPPATQTGAQTMGFLLNGQVWTPSGNVGTSPNLTYVYDPNFNGKPIFNLVSYKVVGNSVQYFFFDVNGIYQPGKYILKKNGNIIVAYNITHSNSTSPCSISGLDTTVYQSGTIVFTKTTYPIFSGTFDVTLYKRGCDTVKITNGRFDLSY